MVSSPPTSGASAVVILNALRLKLRCTQIFSGMKPVLNSDS